MIRHNITHYRIANEIRMLRTRYKDSFLIIEGPSDAKVYYKFTHEQDCRLVLAYGKSNAIKALEELEKSSEDGILVIVDADFWLVEGIPQDQGNLLLTDTHDLETMMLASQALDKVLVECLPGKKLNQLGKLCTRVRDTLLSLGIKLGYLRWINSTESLDLNFKDLPLDSIITTESLGVDVQGLIQASRSRYKGLKTTDAKIMANIQELDDKEYDAWQICQGHDLICILEIILPIIIPKLVGRDAERIFRGKIHPEILDSSLRIAYERSFFEDTNLYALMRNWETKNSPYLIFS